MRHHPIHPARAVVDPTAVATAPRGTRNTVDPTAVATAPRGTGTAVDPTVAASGWRTLPVGPGGNRPASPATRAGSHQRQTRPVGLGGPSIVLVEHQ